MVEVLSNHIDDLIRRQNRVLNDYPPHLVAERMYAYEELINHFIDILIKFE